MQNKDISICYLRCVSMFFIILCHIVSNSSTAIISMTSQFFNVGVSIFFFISGYLFGKKGVNCTVKEFYKRRYWRVFFTYHIFLLILFILYLILNQEIIFVRWLSYVFCIQTIVQSNILGAGHLWFLTVIMICYLVTPFLNNFRSSKNMGLVILTSFMISIIIAFTIKEGLGGNLTGMTTYFIGYYVGMIDYKYSKKSYILATVFIVISVILRLIFKYTFDGTILYNVILTFITQNIFAISIFVIFKNLDLKENKLITFIDSISYEIYLVHYMFIIGPVFVIGVNGNLTHNLLIDSVVILFFILISATILKKVANESFIFIKERIK